MIVRRTKNTIKSIRTWITRPRYRMKDVYAIAGSGRSGTTLLAETLCSTYGWDCLLEPLNLNRSPQAMESGFNWSTTIPTGADRPESAQYLRDAMTGKRESGWFESNSGKSQYLGFPRRKVLVKFAHASRMIGWIMSAIDLQRMTYVVRHPCAVVASQVAMGEREGGTGWAAFQPPEDIQTGFGWIPDDVVNRFGDDLRRLENREQALAGMIMLDNYLASEYWNPERCKLLSYEQLICEPETVLTQIADFYRVPAEPLLEVGINQSSRVASPDLNVVSPHVQIAKWKDKLSDHDTDRILELAHAFGFDCFSRDPEPDYDKLKAIFEKPTNEPINTKVA